MLLAVTAPADNDRSPRYMEKALAAIHQAMHQGDWLKLGYRADEQHVSLFCQLPDNLAEIVSNPLTANYPHCSVAEVAEVPLPRGMSEWSCALTLFPELFPILRHAQFEDLLNGQFADPIDSLLRALRPDQRLRSRVEITVCPAPSRLCRRGKRGVARLDRPFFRAHPRVAEFYADRIARPWRWPLAAIVGMLAWRSDGGRGAALDISAGRHHEREADLQAASDKFGGHLFLADLRLVIAGEPAAEPLARERLRALAGAFGAFTRSRLATFHHSPVVRGRISQRERWRFLVSHEELATLWHPPTAAIQAERLQTTPFAELEPPATIYSGEEPGAVPLGQVRFRSDARSFGLANEDRQRHLYIVGKTGMGKTTLLYNQILADISAGRGVGVVDPHGDLAEGIVRAMPRHRTNDVILFDAGDREFAISFNPLACREPALIDQVTSGAVSAFKKLYDSWGPRLEDTLRNAVFATVEQGGTLLSLMRLLGDPAYRERTVPRIRDELVRSFWMHEFAGWSKPYRTEAVAAIQNKVRPFLTNTSVRAIVSQNGRSLDLRQVMDEGQVLIVNLSKGRLGEDNATLLGAFLVTCLQQAAMTRADIPEADRRDFHLYVDEFQNFTTSSFATILSEARKYRLSLTLSHQYLKQLDETTANAVFGNVGSIIAFQVGSDDAVILAEQLSKFPGQLQPQDLTNLPKYTAYARLLIDGLPSAPFSLRTLPLPIIEDDRLPAVRRASQRQWARAVQAVQAEICRELAV